MLPVLQHFGGADFCRPIPAPHGTGSTLAGRQISRGNSRDFLLYACRLYVTAFRVSIGLCDLCHLLPCCAALTASCSSGQHFASGFLQISPRDEHPCLPLTLPLTGCGGLSPLSRSSATTVEEQRQSRRYAPCPAQYATSADVNGTRNILAAGHAVLACKEMVQSGLLFKQEPTEMIPAIA